MAQSPKPVVNMATIKIKFRPSSVRTKEGTLFYQVIQNRIVRQVNTKYKLLPSEWDRSLVEIVFPQYDDQRRNYLLTIKERVSEDIHRLKKVITLLEQKRRLYTADDVVSAYLSPMTRDTLFTFIEDVIEGLKRIGKIRTSETYTSTLHSFMRFRGGRDILLNEIDSDLMIAYEAYLKQGGISMNTSSFYMRNLRAIYNRALEKELMQKKNPFKHVYTGVDKTVKRAISLKDIKQIKEMDLSLYPALSYARDLFLFSFYTRGMSFIDMAYLKKSDLKNNILTYRRRKTGQQLFIKWEKAMQAIINQYDTSHTPYLLPIIKYAGEDERQQYQYASAIINRKLKVIGNKLRLPIPLTMYCARHSWASIAKSKNIPISVISEGMGHDSEMTTQIYLSSLDTVAVDRANKLILKSL